MNATDLVRRAADRLGRYPPEVLEGYNLARGVTEFSGLEREISDDLADSLAGEQLRGGLLVPPAAMFPAAALDVATTAAGEELIFDRRPIPAAARRPTPRVIALGATVVDGPGTVQLVRVTGGAAITWPGEDPGSDVSDSDPVTGGEDLAVHQGVVSTAYSRKLNASNPGTAGLIERELRAVAAAAVDYAGINGQGAGSNEPTGIVQRSADVNTVDIGANGGALTYAHLTEAEEAPAADDVDEIAPGWLTTPRVRRALRDTESHTGAGPIWRGRFVLGKRGEVSTQVPSNISKGTGTNLHAVLYGADWSNLVLHLLAIEIVTDPFRLKKQGVIEATIFVHVGVGLLHPEAFTLISDADPTA